MRHLLIALALPLLLAACNPAGETSAVEHDDTLAYDNIMTRYSCRQYLTDAVSADTIDMLVRAGMAAPTAVDRRPWHFVVVTGEPLRTLVDSMGYRRGMSEVPAAIAVCGNTRRFLEGEAREYWVQDCSAATENILLAANALNLGTVWTGVYPISARVDKVKRLLNLADTLIPLNVILVGRPAADRTVKDKYNSADITLLGS